MSSDEHSGSDLSSDRLKIMVLSLLKCQVGPMIVIGCQMGCEGAKKKTLSYMLTSFGNSLTRVSRGLLHF